MTGPELVAFWIDKASSAKKGVDYANGYDYSQLISKFIMGAMMYNQAVDNYLDEKLSAKRSPMISLTKKESITLVRNTPGMKDLAILGHRHIL